MGWFNDVHKTKIKLSNRQIVLNTFEDSSPLESSNPLKSRPRLLFLSQKKYLCTGKGITRSQILINSWASYLNSTILKMVANLINLHVATDKLLLWFMLFFFFCVCELRVMVMKYILLLCYFFIDCCKLVFTCFFFIPWYFCFQ